MKIVKLILAGVLLGGGGCATFPGAIAPLSDDMVPPRIAVASFQNRSNFEGQWELGSGMADLLVSELVASRNFVVLERQYLEGVVGEIRRQKLPFFRRENQVEDGRLDNVRYLIRGVITDFSQTSGGSLWMGFRRLFIGTGGYTARVGLTLTIVDVENGTIVDSVRSEGKARASETYLSASYKGVQFGGKAFFQTPLGEATAKAIRRGLKGIVRKIPQQPWQAMIADVQGEQIIINGGRDRGVRVGHTYQARRAGTAVTDPVTGDLLDVLPGEVLGMLEVVEVRDHLAVGVLISGYGFARGQRLERVSLGGDRPQVGY